MDLIISRPHNLIGGKKNDRFRIEISVSLSPPHSVYRIFPSAADCLPDSRPAFFPSGFPLCMILLLGPWFIANAAELSHRRRIPLKFPNFTVHPAVFCHRLSCTAGGRAAGARPSSPEPKGRATVCLMCMLLDGDRKPEAPPSLHLQRRRDSNCTRRGSREWNLQPLQISAAFVVVHFSERDRAAGCGWADAGWAPHLSAAICIALTFICSFGTDMNVFTGAVTQPLQSAPMCRQITSIKELLCCVAADPCCLLLLFCSESVVSQQCSRLVAAIRRNRVSKNREQDVNLLSSVLSYIWVYENT